MILLYKYKILAKSNYQFYPDRRMQMTGYPKLLMKFARVLRVGHLKECSTVYSDTKIGRPFPFLKILSPIALFSQIPVKR